MIFVFSSMFLNVKIGRRSENAKKPEEDRPSHSGRPSGMRGVLGRINERGSEIFGDRILEKGF